MTMGLMVKTILLVSVVMLAGCASDLPRAHSARPTSAPTTQPAIPLRRRGMSSNLLGNPANVVDWLVMMDTPETLSPGTRKGVNLITDAPARLEMVEPGNHDYPRRGEWVSDENETEFEFTELIPSWNVNSPPGTGVRFDVRT